MDIMELGAIGELVGGLAVVGSLLFVGLQMRQSNRLSRAESVQSHVYQRNADVLTPLLDQAFGDTLQRGINDFAGLSSQEQIAVHAYLAKLINLGQAHYVLSRAGLMLPEYATAMDGIVASILRCPGALQWWQTVRSIYASDYIEHVEGLLAAERTPPMTEVMPWFAATAVEA